MIGDATDMLGRIKALLPYGWFRGATPILDAVLAGYAWSLSFVYSLIQYAKLQTRIATATDGFLDLISYDFFGNTLLRRVQEQDNPYRARILATLLREKATRKGMNDALVNLTGRAPIIFEPARPKDTGGYNASICGYGAAGGYGSLKHRAQIFIIAFRPLGAGIPYVAGYGAPSAGYSIPSRGMWANLSLVIGSVTDADIYATIDRVAPAGTEVWVRLRS